MPSLDKAFSKFLKTLRGEQSHGSHARSLGVSESTCMAMDISGAYAANVRAHAPHAIVSFDRFHVIKLMNERLDDLRRELARKAQDHNAKEAIKGLRWLLLHRRDNLAKDAARRLERSLALNEPLQCAYLLKEELAELWEQKDGRKAWGFLREWCAKAKASSIPATPSYGADPPSPCQGGPELLQDRADQRKNGRHQPKNPRLARQRLRLP